MKQSKLGLLNLKDLLKGLILAVITAVLTASLQMLTNVPPAIDFKQIGVVAIISAMGYILKQLSTNNEGELMKKDSDIIGNRPNDR